MWAEEGDDTSIGFAAIGQLPVVALVVMSQLVVLPAVVLLRMPLSAVVLSQTPVAAVVLQEAPRRQCIANSSGKCTQEDLQVKSPTA